MSDSIKAQLTAARQEQIIDAAIVVIRQNGFQNTTIRQIAKEAGVADGTIYNYFKNKDAILLGIIARLTEAETRDIQFAGGAQMDYTAFIQGFVQHRMNEVKQQLDLFKILLPEMIVNETVGQKVYDKIYGPAFTIAENYFSHLISEGKLEAVDPAVMARLFASPLLGLLSLALMGDKHVLENWDTYGETLGSIMSNMFKL